MPCTVLIFGTNQHPAFFELALYLSKEQPYKSSYCWSYRLLYWVSYWEVSLRPKNWKVVKELICCVWYVLMSEQSLFPFFIWASRKLSLLLAQFEQLYKISCSCYSNTNLSLWELFIFLFHLYFHWPCFFKI